MRRNGIQLKGFKLKDGRIVRNEKVYAVNVQLKRQRNGSKRIRYKRSSNQGMGFL